MAGYNNWEVWFADVKFEDSDEVKQRPVVIVENHTAYILALKVTGHEPRKNYPGEYRLKFWREAGLAKPSTVRISKKLYLEDRDLNRCLGRLHPYDIIQIQTFI